LAGGLGGPAVGEGCPTLERSNVGVHRASP
jgi:hypothetical protein